MGKYKREYVDCWNKEQIEEKLQERLQELNNGEEKSKSRVKLLKHKILRLKKALEGEISVGGQILPQNPKKALVKVLKKGKETKKRTKLVCFKCRKRGHLLEDCRENKEETICFRCGSKDHTLKNCKEKETETLPFAKCFVCSKTGHLSSQCPDNPKGIFPNGSGCYFCGSVKHKKADCPELKK